MDISTRKIIDNVVIVGKQSEMTIKQVKSYLEKYNINISTFTLTGEVLPHLNDKIDVIKFGKYADLDKNKIVSIKYKEENKEGETEVKIRKVLDIKAKKQPSKRTFDNQVSMYVYCGKKKNIDENKYVNVKVFLNGRVQLTGCSNMDHCYSAISIINEELKKEKKIGSKMTRFIKNPSQLNIYNVEVRMINSNFDLGYHIQLRILFKLLKNKSEEIFKRYNLEEKLIFSYNPRNHTCVNIKYSYSKRNISIFVFGKGKIIITAAKKYMDIVKAHQFITELINDYREHIELNVVGIKELNSIIKEYEKFKMNDKNKIKVVKL